MKSLEELLSEQNVQKYKTDTGKNISYVRLALKSSYVSKYVIVDKELSSFHHSNNIDYKKQLVVAFGYLKNNRINLISSVEDFEIFLSNKEKDILFDVIVVVSTCDKYQVINFANKESNIVSMSSFQIGKYICNQINNGRSIKDISSELNKSVSLTYKLKRFGMIDNSILELVNCDSLTFKDVEHLHELMKLKERDIFKYSSIINELVNYNSHLKVMDRLKSIFQDSSSIEKSIIFGSGDVKAICSISLGRFELDFRNVDEGVIVLILTKVERILSQYYT